MEIARLEAKIDQLTQSYQKYPRRKFIGSTAKEPRFVQYVANWWQKTQAVGNLNYPADADRQKLYGKLILSVSIKVDGSLEQVEVDRSSGHTILDEAAKKIAQLAAPFDLFPPEISRDTDILTITRTWTFMENTDNQNE